MLKWITKKLVGSKNAREIKKMQPLIAAIGELEPKMKQKSDAELKAMTPYFREKLDQGAKVDDLLVEAFATVREVGRRVLEMRHYDVQLVGGVVLHRGQIAEMKTGEGKTLVATLPIYLNGLTGKGVHLVTVNDYLATRDAEWMGKIYKFLGLSVGTIWHDMPDRERQRAYRCDVTYGQNNEFGFDYLRDNMKESIELYVQRELNYAIVDEVDSILIDEARTPLIISGLKEESAGLYHRCNEVVLRLKKDVDYTVDEKAHSSMLTDSGVEKVEKQLSLTNLYDPQNISWVHHITQALQAHTLYKRNQQYLIEEGKILIIDEFTGRKMPGRRWSDGLHQAIEAKENVNIEEETLTLATISFQNLFRLYGKLAGMTGTAETEAEEFYKIYKLDVTVIPTNRDLLRTDYDDVIYKSERFKFQFVIDEIVDCQQRGQPVLVGTASVDKSEVLSKMLRKRGIKHNVLNAKQHEREAGVIAQAGRKGAVTIATNMAGRGTDILLGGNPEKMAEEVADPETAPDQYKAALEKFRVQCAGERKEVIAAGGLHILGTERHEARRIDNQLRGRSGRQGDPGSARFYLSLEDDLLRVFGADRIQGLMERLGMKDDEPIEHRWVNKAIENAQKRVEGHNFDIRKHLLEYDDVMNQQRKSIYALRKSVLEGRYVPTLSEAEQKEGKKPEVPVKSGKWTIESLTQEIRPRVSEIVRGFLGRAAAGNEEPSEDGGEHPYRDARQVDPEKLDPEALTRELYRNFGAMVSFDKHQLRDESGVIKKTSEEVAASLIQQRERILDLMDMAIADAIDVACPEKAHADDWDLDVLEEKLLAAFNAKITLGEVALDRQHIAERIWEQAEKLVDARETELSLFYFLYFARHFYLDEIDSQWIDHLRAMDYLRQGIGLEGYGQRDPKQIYKQRGFDMFSEMMSRIQANVTNKLFRIQIEREEDNLPAYERKRRRMTLGRGDVPGGEAGEGKAKTVRRSSPRIGRNDPCPCGSGKKYKKCCMARDEAAAG